MLSEMHQWNQWLIFWEVIFKQCDKLSEFKSSIFEKDILLHIHIDTRPKLNIYIEYAFFSIFQVPDKLLLAMMISFISGIYKSLRKMGTFSNGKTAIQLCKFSVVLLRIPKWPPMSYSKQCRRHVGKGGGIKKRSGSKPLCTEYVGNGQEGQIEFVRSCPTKCR